MVQDTAAGRRPGPPSWKSWVRFAVSGALLALLVLKADDLHLDGLLPDRHPVRTAVMLTTAVIVMFFGVALSAWRWQRVLGVFDVEVGLRTLTSHYLASLFVGNVLPSTIGGDVLRVTRCGTTIGSTSTAFASVTLERLTGFVALPLLVFAGFAARPSLLDVDRALVALLTAGITLAALGVVLFLAGHPNVAGRFRDHDNWMRFIGAIHVGVDRLRRDPRQTLAVLGTALVYQASVVLGVWLVVRTLDLAIPAAAVLAYVPAVQMAQVLPLSISGLGVREGMLVLLLTPFGVGNGEAIAVGLLWYGSLLLVSMAGAPSFAIGHPRRRVSAEPVSVERTAAP